MSPKHMTRTVFTSTSPAQLSEEFSLLSGSLQKTSLLTCEKDEFNCSSVPEPELLKLELFLERQQKLLLAPRRSVVPFTGCANKAEAYCHK